MPTETETAFLVDPLGHAPEALTENDFKQVRRLLDIENNEKELPLREAVGWLLYLSTSQPGMDDRTIFGRMVQHYLSEVLQSPGTGGILTDAFGSKIEIISDDELQVLQWTLTAIRARGWFAEWLAIQLCSIACNSTEPASRFPSPLKIASTLMDWIKEHQHRMDAARDMVRMHPDLLFPAPPEPQTTPEPPAAEGTTQPATKQAAKARGGRKPRNKVARAAA